MTMVTIGTNHIIFIVQSAHRANRDCLEMFAERVREAGVVTAAELRAIDKDVEKLIEEAVAAAKAAPLPTIRDLTTDVYVAY